MLLKGYLEKKLGQRNAAIAYGAAAVSLLILLWIFTSMSKDHRPTPVTSASSAVTEENPTRFVLIKPAALVLDNQGSVTGGVLAGIAYFFAVPLWLLRTGLVLVVIGAFKWVEPLGWFLVLLYVLLWIFVPSVDFIPSDFITRTGG